jgi:calcineurin-like phosphoesterase family protein/2'-5' RNA ligase
MAATYLVEIRFGEPIKPQLKNVIKDIADRFHERELVHSHYVSHVTLYGPFSTQQEKTVLARLRDVCAQFDIVPFRVDGFDHFDRETIYADVHSSRALRTIRHELSQELQPVTSNEQPYDHDAWFKFHSTVARNVGGRFGEIWSYVASACDFDYDGYVKRINLIRNGDIVKEYSLPQGRFLSSDAATSRPAWKRDETIIERHRRPDDHEGPVPSQPFVPVRCWTLLTDWASSRPEKRRLEFFESREPRTFISGDLHLNHGNIVEYCDRPFDSVYEMNQELVANWNDTVGPDDTVVFLGDLCFYYGDITTHDWLHALNGEIVYIRGNHDGAESIDYEDEYILETDRRRYYCTHRPADVPDDWDGWVIHGHHHNNYVETYPFIDPADRRINAAPELMGYAPCSIERIENAIEHADTPIRCKTRAKTC